MTEDEAGELLVSPWVNIGIRGLIYLLLSIPEPTMDDAEGPGSATERSLTEWDQLVAGIFECEDCPATYKLTGKPKYARHFVTLKRDPNRHHKFPIIGALGRAPLLIVAVCPRYTDNRSRTNNVPLHEFAMTDLSNFKKLAANWDENGLRYIRPKPRDGRRELFYRELFYEDHARIANDVYGKPFEDVAVATEMYLCAMPPGKPHNLTESPCAVKFLLRTIRLTQPEFIITCHSDIRAFFRRFVAASFETGWPEIEAYQGACVIHLPQLKHDGNTSLCVDWAIKVMNAVKGNVTAPKDSDIPRPNLSNGCPQEVWIYAVGGKPREIPL